MGDIKNIYKAVKDESVTMLYEDALPDNPNIQAIEEENEKAKEPIESEPFSSTLLTIICLCLFAIIIISISTMAK